MLVSATVSPCSIVIAQGAGEATQIITQVSAAVIGPYVAGALPTDAYTPGTYESSAEVGGGGASAWDTMVTALAGSDYVASRSSDLTTQFQTIGGTTAAVVDSPVGYISDIGPNSIDLSAANDSARCVLRDDSGVKWWQFDGSVNTLRNTSFASFPDRAACRFAFTYKGTGTVGIFIYSVVNSIFAGYFKDADASAVFSSGAGSPTVHVDGGTALASRDAFHDAITGGAAHTIMIKNLNLSTWANFGLPQTGGLGVAGKIGAYVLVDETTGAAEEAEILAALNAEAGL